MPEISVLDHTVRTAHDHNGGYPMRAFPGRPGVWVQRHGDWCRPLSVWLYRGAWRVLCFSCMVSIRSDNDLYGRGWPSLGEAFDAAVAHCGGCAGTVTV